MAAALAAVPWLMHTLGQERMGVLSLIWVVVGYFSFLDMGLGRAVTVAVAALRSGDPNRLHADELHVLGSAGALLFGLGALAAVMLGIALVVGGASFAVSSPGLQAEVVQALLWSLPSLPLLLLSSALRGHLEGVGAFRVLNLVRMPTGIGLVLGPCLSAAWSPSLVGACITILLVRALHALVLLHLVAQQMQRGSLRFGLLLVRSASRRWLRRLLSFGGWVTVSNLVGPLIVYVDRFVIGVGLSAGAVALYSIPFDLVSRLPILVAALGSVLLPELARLSSLAAVSEPAAAKRARELVWRASAWSLVVVAGLLIPLILIAPWALAIWLGQGFSDKTTELTRVLLLAFGVNALAQIPFTALQALGRVRAVALLHCAELLPYAAAVFWAIAGFGLVGAAWAWLLRSIVDYGVLAWMWHRHPACATAVLRT